MTVESGREFEAFVASVEPSLRRALGGHLPAALVPDALAEAFAYAWQHWSRLRAMGNPTGYLFRVAQSKTRSKRAGLSPATAAEELPDIEPGLLDAMRSLSSQQRSVVWLVHGCGWTTVETAEAMGISASAVGTHLQRGMARLRDRMGVRDHG
jgi:DNA-directed RNA polymerase specialized sigma24 family protein